MKIIKIYINRDIVLKEVPMSRKKDSGMHDSKSISFNDKGITSTRNMQQVVQQGMLHGLQQWIRHLK
jgi:hypothetical protein